MFKRIRAFGVTCAILCTIMCGTVQAASVPFSDVPATAPYYNEVMYCRDKGITSGVGNNRFAPNNPVSNFEAATMILRAFQPSLLADGKSAVDVSYFNGWIESWNYANPYGQITLSDLINLSLRAKGLYNYCGNAMETAVDMGLYKAGENGARVAKRSDCAYLIGKLAVNTYTPDWTKLDEKLNIVVGKEFEGERIDYYVAASGLPDAVLSKWDASGNILEVSFEAMSRYTGGDVYPVYSGMYYGKGIVLITPDSMYHEFGHYIHYTSAYKDLKPKVSALFVKYKDEVDAVLGGYAASNDKEFFAECFSSYMGEALAPSTRADLKEKMPDMFNLLADMEATNWGV